MEIKLKCLKCDKLFEKQVEPALGEIMFLVQNETGGEPIQSLCPECRIRMPSDDLHEALWRIKDAAWQCYDQYSQPDIQKLVEEVVRQVRAKEIELGFNPDLIIRKQKNGI